MTQPKLSQLQTVREQLLFHGSVRKKSYMMVNVCLPARIKDLKAEGWEIEGRHTQLNKDYIYELVSTCS